MKAIAGTDLKKGQFVYRLNFSDEHGEAKVFPAPLASAAWPSNSIGFTLTKDYAKGEEIPLFPISP